MKKQTKKLSLNKKTISNLTAAVMDKKVGGSKPTREVCTDGCPGHTHTQKNGNTCPGHNTCYC